MGLKSLLWRHLQEQLRSELFIDVSKCNLSEIQIQNPHRQTFTPHRRRCRQKCCISALQAFGTRQHGVKLSLHDSWRLVRYFLDTPLPCIITSVCLAEAGVLGSVSTSLIYFNVMKLPCGLLSSCRGVQITAKGFISHYEPPSLPSPLESRYIMNLGFAYWRAGCSLKRCQCLLESRDDFQV